MNPWIKPLIAIVIILNLAGLITLFIKSNELPKSLDERKIENRLDALLEAAKEDSNRRNLLAQHGNKLTMQTLDVLGRSGTIALLGRADIIKKDLFLTKDQIQTEIIEEPGPNGVAERKIITKKLQAKSKSASIEILKQFKKIAFASFGPLNDQKIEVNISRNKKIIYSGSYRLKKDDKALEYKREILFPIGEMTISLELRLRTLKMQPDPFIAKDSRFSSWLRDGNVLYGIYWLDVTGNINSLWHNEPANILLGKIQNDLLPWPDKYQFKKISTGDEIIFSWVKPLRYQDEKAIAIAVYKDTSDANMTNIIFAGIGLNILILICIVSFANPKPIIVSNGTYKRKSTNRNTNISTLRNLDSSTNHPMSKNKRNRNSDIVRHSFKEYEGLDINDNSHSDILKSLLKKMRK